MNKILDLTFIRAAAHSLRAELGLKGELFLDLSDVLARLKQVHPTTKIKIVPAKNAPALAWTESKTKTLYIQESVIKGLARGDAHARYIIAHEMGHLFLKHQAVRNLGAVQSEAYDQQKQEMEAALFANEFLAPFHLSEQPKNAGEITAAFRAHKRTGSQRIAELVVGGELPVAPAARARTDVIDELMALGYSESEISELVVPKRTLARRRADQELLTVEETDKALRLSRIAKLAFHVFGDSEKANRWLRKPKHSLNGETPVAFLASEEGARKVEEMLHRIEHGMAA